MDIEKAIGRLTIIVPLIHLLACGLYMAGYSTGFGGNIGGMFTASDFFTITIQHLVTTYVLSLGMPVAVIFLRHRSGRTYAADLIAKEEDPAKKAKLVDTREWVIWFTTWALPLLGLLPLGLLACQIWTDAPRDYYLPLTMLLLALLPIWWRAANRLNFYGLPVELAWCALSFAVGVLGLGLNAGDRDRRWPQAAFVDSRMRCGKHVVLNPIGERFLTVTPDNRRHLTDDECKVQFDFAPTTIVRMDSLANLVSAKLNPAPPPRPSKPTTTPTRSPVSIEQPRR